MSSPQKHQPSTKPESVRLPISAKIEAQMGPEGEGRELPVKGVHIRFEVYRVYGMGFVSIRL